MKIESINPHRYVPGPVHKTAVFRVEVMLDSVPGPWNTTDDFIKWFFRHNYVQNVELEQDPEISEQEMVDAEARVREIEESWEQRMEEIL